MISDHDEGTFALLRYSLGGDRPSQTTHHALSPGPIQGPRLEFQTVQGGISTATPHNLATASHSLPPILHKTVQNSEQSYSKGARGLSV